MTFWGLRRCGASAHSHKKPAERLKHIEEQRTAESVRPHRGNPLPSERFHPMGVSRRHRGRVWPYEWLHLLYGPGARAAARHLGVVDDERGAHAHDGEAREEQRWRRRREGERAARAGDECPEGSRE